VEGGRLRRSVAYRQGAPLGFGCQGFGSHKGCHYMIHGYVFVVAALVAAIIIKSPHPQYTDFSPLGRRLKRRWTQ
jgi:hypothetical protein